MTKVRSAAAVALIRGRGEELEVYLVERDPRLRFFGGYWAFPGGAVDPEDASHPVHSDAHHACAVREIREEIAVELDSLTDICTLTTPEFSPVRFETRFFLADLPPGAEPAVQSGELSDGRFFRPGDALERWRKGELMIAPPILLMLEFLEDGNLEAFGPRARAEAEALTNGKLHPVRFSPGIFVAPLRASTKPPALTTNCVLVGESRIFIVDPGATEAANLEPLFRKLDSCLAAGRELAGILLTHHHPDHVGGAPAVAGRYALDAWAHPQTLERVSIPGAALRPLDEGDTLTLGTAPDGSVDWQLEVLHTPGHTEGHLAFRESRYRAFIAGDLFSTVSTVVIEPPEGHLATYLKTLERVRNLPITTLYPGHGPAHRDGRALARRYLEHRAEREKKLADALDDVPRSIEALVPIVYADTDPRLYPLAARSLHAGLLKLEEEDRARRQGERWTIAGTD